MARKAPTATQIERALDEAQNATVAALSDVRRWLDAAGGGDEYRRRQSIERLAYEATAKYADALRILRTAYLDEPTYYPVPSSPLHPGA